MLLAMSQEMVLTCLAVNLFSVNVLPVLINGLVHHPAYI